MQASLHQVKTATKKKPKTVSEEILLTQLGSLNMVVVLALPSSLHTVTDVSKNAIAEVI